MLEMELNLNILQQNNQFLFYIYTHILKRQKLLSKAAYMAIPFNKIFVLQNLL